MAGPEGPLVWIDCEMTGLDPDTDAILEIFSVVTTRDLTLVDAGWHAVVHQPEDVMARMGAWCARTHAASGLTAAVAESTTTAAAAAEGLLAYVQRHAPAAGTALLAGNSVHADRAFLRRAPWAAVVEHLHYRILDVSSLKEAARMWAPHVAAGAPKKKGAHTAREDILESIAEARYYKMALFERKAA